MSKRSQRIFFIIVLSLIILVWVGYDQCKLGLRRHQYGIGGYADALGWFRDKYDRYPLDLKELEDAYNKSEDRRVSVLPLQPGRIPIYRGVPKNSEGLFLVFVERAPPEWRGRYYRYVLYAYADRQFPGGADAGIRTKLIWNIDEAIAEDDAKRAALNTLK